MKYKSNSVEKVLESNSVEYSQDRSSSIENHINKQRLAHSEV